MTGSSSDLITADLVVLQLRASDRQDAIRQLAGRFAAAGRVTDLDGFLADVAAREQQMATGMPGGVGLPHARSAAVTAPSLGVATALDGVDFGAPDGPATLIFLIGVPDGAGSEHLTILASLARRLVRPGFRRTIVEATDPETVAHFLREQLAPR
ncbi:PTS sugar transporter subunit IIA [Nakamurella leprariae]|uniref:PTS sugar transporter subunit IIA n=1 Tax=Nakamurella leprariae TaxID=2803911 RepID=A0A939BXQ1_9ACTN|nr:PTS sugar transporter subunit IIA [Nakamurella leprariae]MBM9465821.1 PTS sugar transporter subunit IIA [Nakamurella leprariae]